MIYSISKRLFLILVLIVNASVAKAELPREQARTMTGCRPGENHAMAQVNFGWFERIPVHFCYGTRGHPYWTPGRVEIWSIIRDNHKDIIVQINHDANGSFFKGSNAVFTRFKWNVRVKEKNGRAIGALTVTKSVNNIERDTKTATVDITR